MSNQDRKRVSPNIIEISGINGKTYEVIMTIDKIDYCRTFKTLEEAIEFKDNSRKNAARSNFEYPDDLIEELGLYENNRLDIDYIEKHFEENFEYLLSRAFLTSREEVALKGYYVKGYTLEAIGLQLGVNRERIRQILAKAIRKMKRPSRLDVLKYGKELIEEQENVVELIMQIKGKKQFLEQMNVELDEKIKNIMINGEVSPLTSIRELDLSIRSLNCLRRADINTLGDLLDKTEEDMMKIRNLGRKSLKEIIRTLDDMGLHLKDYDKKEKDFYLEEEE